MKKYLLFISFILLGWDVQAQILDSENRLTILLSDGTQVVLYGKATALSDEKSREYYYLPVNPRLSFRPDGTPEFLFTKFTSETRQDQGGISGALMHFLMEWGLPPTQEAELKKLLQEQHKAQLMGAVDVQPAGDQSFRIISATVNASEAGLTESMITSGKAPVLPGQKIAVASRLNQYGAQLLASSFEKSRSVTDLSLELSFNYTLRYPAARGRAVIDWSRFQEQLAKDSAAYSRQTTRAAESDGYWGKMVEGLFGRKEEHSFSYEEMHAFYDELQESKIVTVEFDEGQESERVSKVREAFFEYFLNQLSSEVAGERLTLPGKKEQESMPDIKHGKQYAFSMSKLRKSMQSGRKEFNLSYRLAIEKSFAITGNMGSWYDGVRDNPRCVNTVNLNDPFFQHRDINFILDLDAKEMFDKEVNYVTVNIKKKRAAGHDFSDRVTIDKKHLETEGLMAQLTYARGEDKNPDLYQYQVQWSLRGGNLFPAQPAWHSGEWEGVTLAPPVKPRLIELEADPEELKTNQITRVTAQIRYAKFQQEQEVNIQLSPARNEAIVSEQIFLDKDAKGYAYRLIFNHKEQGKLATNWQVQLNDDYIFAVIPAEWKKLDQEEDELDLESPLLEEAKKAGQSIIEDASKTVLDKFTSLIK